MAFSRVWNRQWLRRRSFSSDLLWVDGSPITSTGAGSSSSIFRWGSYHSSLPGSWSKIRLTLSSSAKKKRAGAARWILEHSSFSSAIGLGFLQIMLDKGDREDWFASDLIRVCAFLAAAGLVMAIVWELHVKDPVVDLSLLKERNFRISAFFMFMVGVVLLGSTVLIPQYLQLVMGYSATDAGLAISPGGVLIILVLPFVGFMLGKVEARWLILVGLIITSLALWNMTNFDTQMSQRTAILARCYQALGLAFLFVPINTAAYAFVPRTKNNAASGLVNLARNVGGSVGISMVTSVLTRRSQFHQARLTEFTTSLNPQMTQALTGAQNALVQHGATFSDASKQAYGNIMFSLQRQASVLAYIDCFYLLAIVFACLIPLAFLMKKTKPGGGVAAH